MVYGFIRQSGGDARIHSQVGFGTTVKLYLPRFNGEAAETETLTPAHAPAPVARHATVLVVEDEELVRALVLDVLSELGLSVVAAGDGPAGLEILQSKQPIDLLITDIGLPGLNGRQVADAARLLRPALKILFMTGYAETAAMANGFLEPGMALITKPFPVGALTERVRNLIEIM
jgi:CheY-like chemotaxis protein